MNHLAEQLTDALRRQNELKAEFGEAYPSQETLDEIELNKTIKDAIEFRQTQQSFLARHIRTDIHESWPTLTAPQKLKKAIEEWVSDIDLHHPPKTGTQQT